MEDLVTTTPTVQVVCDGAAHWKKIHTVQIFVRWDGWYPIAATRRGKPTATVREDKLVSWSELFDGRPFSVELLRDVSKTYDRESLKCRLCPKRTPAANVPVKRFKLTPIFDDLVARGESRITLTDLAAKLRSDK
jgi:hypothetical protein